MKKVISVVFLATVFCVMAYSQVPSGAIDAYRITRYIKTEEDFTSQVYICHLLRNSSMSDLGLVITRNGKIDFSKVENVLDAISLENYNLSDKQFKRVVFNGKDFSSEGFTVVAEIRSANDKLYIKIMVAEAPELVILELEGTFIASTDSL